MFAVKTRAWLRRRGRRRNMTGAAKNEESHREYYIPSTPRYTASHSVSFRASKARPTLRNSSTRFFSTFYTRRGRRRRRRASRHPRCSAPDSERERARDSSSIAPSPSPRLPRHFLAVRCCLTSVGKTSYTNGIVGARARVLVSRHLFTGCQISVCLPCCAP